MNKFTRLTTISIPAIVGLGVAWIGNRIIRNENKLKNRELELKIKLSNDSTKVFK